MTRLIVKPNRIERDMDHLFHNFFNAPLWNGFEGETSDYTPRVDIVETENHLKLDFELPGLNKDDIKIVVKDGLLTVKGEKKFADEETKDRYIRTEIRSGSFERSFKLPKTVDSEQVEANYKNGILEVKLQKKEEAKPKEIEVKIA